MELLGFLLATAAVAVGLLAIIRLARGRSVLPRLWHNTALRGPKVRQLSLALVVGAAALLLTRWPLAGAGAFAVALLWPRLFGGGAAGRRQLEKIEALASWTESLRDTASAAAGLEQAIPATVPAAHVLLRAPVRDLAARLDGRVPLPEALTRFADDVDDPAADMVVAALSLNARQRAGGLERILSALAASSRIELEMRRKVELERRALRRQAQRIAIAVLGFVALQAVFARGWIAPYSTLLGQLVLAVLAGMFLGAFHQDALVVRERAGAEVLDDSGRRHRDRLLQAAPCADRRSVVIAFMVAVGLVAVALAHAYRVAVPPRVDLPGAVQRWDSSRARATRIQRIGAPRATSIGGRIQSWLAEQVLRRARDIKQVTQDLAVTGATMEQQVGKTTVLVLAGFFGPILILGFLSAIGLGLPAVVAVAVGVALAAAMVIVTRQELAETAKRRRAEFRRTLSIYLDLVAMSMQAGRGHAEALPASAAIGTGWAFTHIQDAIDGARFSGTTPWQALGQLGDRFGIRELTDLDAALTLANEDGAKVRATLVARAGTLRAERIADAEAAAARATESMRFALIVMVFAFLTYELYPSVARLFAG